MALIASHLPFLDACHRHGLIGSPTWTLGSQQFLDPQAAGLSAGSGAADLFRARYGVEEYLDFDLNDDADVQLDLAAALPPERRHGAATVLEAGTLEHVFHLGDALRTVHEMIRPGGAFVALVPVSWWNHGFVNLNPRLLAGFGLANGYEPVLEGFLFRVSMPGVGVKAWTVFTRDGEVRPRTRLWVDRLLNRALPARTLYLAALRKNDDRPFTTPTDVFPNW